MQGGAEKLPRGPGEEEGRILWSWLREGRLAAGQDGWQYTGSLGEGHGEGKEQDCLAPLGHVSVQA